MALNDGFAVDAQGRRIYFPPVGKPRLVPSTLDEAKFGGVVFIYAMISFAILFVASLTLNLTLEEPYGFYAEWLILPLLVHQLAASLRARRWPALNDPNYTYHRFVISTLRRENTGWLRCKLIVSAILAISFILLAGSLAIKLQSEWAAVEGRDNADRLFVILVALAAAPFCALHAYRIQVALRRQKERRALSA